MVVGEVAHVTVLKALAMLGLGLRAREAGAWVHVDGAFGLWAAVSPRYAPLVAGNGLADSWAIDCHRWLKVPYDSGLALVRSPEHLRKALALTAAYLFEARPGYRDPGRDALAGACGVEGSDRAQLPVRPRFRRET